MGYKLYGTKSMGQTLWEKLYGTNYGTSSMGQTLWNKVYGTYTMEQILRDKLYGMNSMGQTL